MGNILEQLPRGARVAVVRLRSLGDCVLTTPALHILKTSRPDLSIAVVVEPRFAAVFENNPDVDALLAPHFHKVTPWRAALCLNLHGGTRSAVLTAGSAARFRAGFAHYRHSFAYNVRIPTAQEILGVSRKVHTAEHLASAVFHLGAPRVEIPRARLFCEARPAARPYAVLHPVASAPEKTWPAESFLAIARRIRECGMEPAFIGGPQDDLSAFSGEYRCVVGAPLPSVKALLAAARLFVGNDSGPAHIAAAFGIPVVAIFGASDHEVWRPWRTASETVVARGDIGSVTVDEVWGAVERLGVAA